ncbi:MAG: hypothetical protein GY820_01630 [Gammaproteobacteria bacterium]|nr:hypothetical protein [Gammaproteobacteria bacterium]
MKFKQRNIKILVNKVNAPPSIPLREVGMQQFLKKFHYEEVADLLLSSKMKQIFQVEERQ